MDKEFHEEMTEAELDLQDLEMGEADEEVIKLKFAFFLKEMLQVDKVIH